MSKSTQVASVMISREQFQGHNGHGWTTESQTVVRAGEVEAAFSRLPRGGFRLSVIDRNTSFAANQLRPQMTTRKRQDLADAIQERCIARMRELGLNPNQVAERVGDKISRTHVCDYLGRRASLGSHKLQHLLAVLRLKLTEGDLPESSNLSQTAPGPRKQPKP